MYPSRIVAPNHHFHNFHFLTYFLSITFIYFLYRTTDTHHFLVLRSSCIPFLNLVMAEIIFSMFISNRSSNLQIFSVVGFHGVFSWPVPPHVRKYDLERFDFRCSGSFRSVDLVARLSSGQQKFRVTKIQYENALLISFLVISTSMKRC